MTTFTATLSATVSTLGKMLGYYKTSSGSDTLSNTVRGHLFSDEFELATETLTFDALQTTAWSRDSTNGVMKWTSSTATDGGSVAVRNITPNTDYVIATRAQTNSSSANNNFIGIVGRYTLSANGKNGYYTDIASDFNVMRIERVSVQTLASTAFTVVASTYYRVRGVISGSSLKGLAESTALSVSDTTYAGQTLVGLIANKDSATAVTNTYDYLRVYTSQVITVTNLSAGNYVEVLTTGSPWNPGSTDGAIVATATVGAGQTSVTLDMSGVADHPPYKNLNVWATSAKLTLLASLGAADLLEGSVTTHTTAGTSKGVYGGDTWTLSGGITNNITLFERVFTSFPSPSIIKAIFKTLTQTVSTATTLLNRFWSGFRSLSQTISTSTALTQFRTVPRTLTAAVSTSVSTTLARFYSGFRTLTSNIATTGSVSRIRQTIIQLSQTVTTNTIVSRLQTKVINLIATVVVAINIFGRQYFGFRTFSPVITTSITLFRGFLRQLLATVNTSAAVNIFQKLFRTVIASVSTSSVVSPFQKLFRTLTISISTASNIISPLVRLRTLTASVAITSSVSRLWSLFRTFNVTVSTGSTISRFFNGFRTLTQTVTTSGIVSKLGISVRTLIASVSTSSVLARFANIIRQINVTIATSGIVSRFVSLARSISSTVSIVSTILRTRTDFVILIASIATSGVVSRFASLTRTVTATVTTLGNIIRSKALSFVKALLKILQGGKVNLLILVTKEGVPLSSYIGVVEFIQGDINQIISLQVTDSAGQVLDLSGVTLATLKMANVSTPTVLQVNNSTNTTITDALNGKLRYTFQTGDLSTAGDYILDVVLTFAAGQNFTARAKPIIRVIQKLGP